MVNLTWITSSETNNKGFFIERKKDNGSWNTIGFVYGSGTVNVNKNYSFADRSITVGSYSYRLKQVDYDDTFIFSQEVNIGVLFPLYWELYQNYPNPFN